MIADLWRHTLSSTLFLSRLPLTRLLRAEDRDRLPDFGETAHTFPLAGILIALPAVCVAALGMALGLPALSTAFLTVLTGTFMTGALHEDGLADVCDGFWGGYERERKLAIMRDSAIGTYGVLGLLLTIGLKVSLMAHVFALNTLTDSLITLLVAASLSRAAMLYPWHRLAPARAQESKERDEHNKEKAGLSARYGMPDSYTYYRAALWSIPLLALLWASCGIIALVLGLGLLKLATVVVSHLARHHIGGHTGDVLGATQQIGELAFWLGLALASSFAS